ncbi:unnamed protein product [Larinioides sclopetarius]|uniref:Uncharacterized protein n=1 Tax=Larinioides sclopetarius TaxID=280406 RepID=A0AAV2AAD5_9ARAC
MEKNSHLLSLSKRLSINHGEHATFTIDMSFDIDVSIENPSNPAKSETQDSEERSVCVINKKEGNSDKNNHANEPDLVKNHLHNSRESLYSFLDIFGSAPSSVELHNVHVKIDLLERSRMMLLATLVANRKMFNTFKRKLFSDNRICKIERIILFLVSYRTP